MSTGFLYYLTFYHLLSSTDQVLELSSMLINFVLAFYFIKLALKKIKDTLNPSINKSYSSLSLFALKMLILQEVVVIINALFFAAQIVYTQVNYESYEEFINSDDQSKTKLLVGANRVINVMFSLELFINNLMIITQIYEYCFMIYIIWY